ncbi:unnamed protein product [Amoebophrya sp. A120]|nr:unnamed protein product [Amoebophrya sp. A120]|eukprot:GSA120T00001961001.1
MEKLAGVPPRQEMLEVDAHGATHVVHPGQRQPPERGFFNGSSLLTAGQQPHSGRPGKNTHNIGTPGSPASTTTTPDVVVNKRTSPAAPRGPDLSDVSSVDEEDEDIILAAAAFRARAKQGFFAAAFGSSGGTANYSQDELHQDESTISAYYYGEHEIRSDSSGGAPPRRVRRPGDENEKSKNILPLDGIVLHDEEDTTPAGPRRPLFGKNAPTLSKNSNPSSSNDSSESRAGPGMKLLRAEERTGEGLGTASTILQKNLLPGSRARPRRGGAHVQPEGEGRSSGSVALIAARRAAATHSDERRSTRGGRKSDRKSWLKPDEVKDWRKIKTHENLDDEEGFCNCDGESDRTVPIFLASTVVLAIVLAVTFLFCIPATRPKAIQKCCGDEDDDDASSTVKLGKGAKKKLGSTAPSVEDIQRDIAAARSERDDLEAQLDNSEFSERKQAEIEESIQELDKKLRGLRAKLKEAKSKKKVKPADDDEDEYASSTRPFS